MQCSNNAGDAYRNSRMGFSVRYVHLTSKSEKKVPRSKSIHISARITKHIPTFPCSGKVKLSRYRPEQALGVPGG